MMLKTVLVLSGWLIIASQGSPTSKDKKQEGNHISYNKADFYDLYTKMGIFSEKKFSSKRNYLAMATSSSKYENLIFLKKMLNLKN